MIYKHGKHEVEVFDSIHELPILRFQRYNKYSMQAAEIGNTFADYLQRGQKMLAFLQKGMVEEAVKELENRNQTVFNALNEFAPKGKAFAILVKRIDDKYYNTFTPQDLDECLQHLERIEFTIAESNEAANAVKKKIEAELVTYYPKFFPKNGNREQTALRHKRIGVLLDRMTDPGPSHDKNLYDVEKSILEQDKPNVWNIHVEGNMEKSLEVNFRKFALAVTKYLNQELEIMTTFTFYAGVELIEQQNK